MLAALWHSAPPLATAAEAEARPTAPDATGSSHADPLIATRYLTGLDLEGRAHRLGSGEEFRAVAVVFLGTECPIARQYVPELNRLAASLEGKAAQLLGVLYEPTLTRAEAVRFQQEFQINFPILFDGSGSLAAALAPTHVPEAFLLDAQGAVVYRGRIDNLYAELKKKRPAATEHNLADALEATLAGQPVAVAHTTPVGCPLPARHDAAAASTEVTYTRDIAPLLFTHCAECHRPGEVAPFSLLTYDDAASRADFLAEMTGKGLMPPWKAEIGHGRFLGERHLTKAEVDLLAAWAAAGAPEGHADDLPPQPEFPSGWRLGVPDLVLEAPASFEVPADGPDLFQHWVIPIDIPEDKTIIGFEFRPGNPSVVHHAILFLDSMGAARRKDAETPEPGFVTFGSIGVPTSGMIGVWTPGMTPRFFPEGVGIPIRPGTDLVLQLHLHPSGKVESDQSSVALYFADKDAPPARPTSIFVVGTLMIDIPADSEGHTITSSVTLPTDVSLISLLPHMHLIGKEMKITATLPDGTIEPLMWISDWNFYWQDNYVYHQPVRLPAGTRLDVLSRYDNSAENPFNPSQPPQRVLFGNDSTDEMCFGLFQVVPDVPEQQRRLQSALIQSFMTQWNDPNFDPVARERIAEEAAKLFGGESRQLFDLLGAGARGAREGENQRERPRRQRTPRAPSTPSDTR